MRIGIIGGGQLGRMLAMAGYPLGYRFTVLDPAEDSPAGQLARQITAKYDDRSALKHLAETCDVVTYEFENVPVESALIVQGICPIYPPPLALELSQDRLSEKQFAAEVGIPTPRFMAVNSREDLADAISSVGLPAILKTRRLGYDGKGQFVLKSSDDLDALPDEAFQAPGGLILEEMIPFERELSLLGVRSITGEMAFYPLVENHHREGILRLSLAPARQVSRELHEKAVLYGRSVLSRLEYAGVLAIELFQVGDSLVFNEMAPRVHNSGHWTIEGSVTSQFENHIRAIADLPLGDISCRGDSAMFNLVGFLPEASSMLKVKGAHLHLYGKEARPGRKIGHLTLNPVAPESFCYLRSMVETSQDISLPDTSL